MEKIKEFRDRRTRIAKRKKDAQLREKDLDEQYNVIKKSILELPSVYYVTKQKEEGFLGGEIEFLEFRAEDIKIPIALKKSNRVGAYATKFNDLNDNFTKAQKFVREEEFGDIFSSLIPPILYVGSDPSSIKINRIDIDGFYKRIVEASEILLGIQEGNLETKVTINYDS